MSHSKFHSSPQPSKPKPASRMQFPLDHDAITKFLAKTKSASQVEFPREKVTVPLTTLRHPITPEIKAAVKELACSEVRQLSEKANANLQQMIEQTKKLLQSTAKVVLMTNEVRYSSQINALFPLNDKIYSSNYSRTSTLYLWESSWAQVGEFQNYPGVIITNKELTKIRPTLGDKGDGYFFVNSITTTLPRSGDCYGTLSSDQAVINSLPEEITQDFVFKNFVESFLVKSPKKRFYCNSGDKGDCYESLIYDFYNVNKLPIYRLHAGGVLQEELTPGQVLAFWCLYDLTPEAWGKDKLYKQVKKEVRENFAILDASKGQYITPKDLSQKVFNLVPQQLIEDTLQGRDTILKGKLPDLLNAELLQCDVNRSAITPPYSKQKLVDPNGGHWDLWDVNQVLCPPDQPTVEISTPFYARNPRFDISKGGIIGIDFGTRSTTVVSFQDGQLPRALRIGNGDYTQAATSPRDYENPTVIQFIDLKNFLTHYRARDGRPLTRWHDVTISNTAADTLRDSEDSKTFPSFLTDLKQWAGGNHILRLVDRNSYGFDLPPFCENDPEEINPIELYAYYLGLHINNMHRKIFLHYQLSYPVTYDKPVLDRLLKSFERGIKKSLPSSILRDPEIMKDFWVKYGASEPAAYALCALQEYGLDPDGEEKYLYGIFDFGGGTTDFDFGIFRGATAEEENQNYYQCLEHFRPSGDKFLGGENLLQRIAFEVFRQNSDTLRQEGIIFPKPYEKANTDFNSDEGLVVDSPEAQINMHRLMEKLRPIWEHAEFWPAAKSDAETTTYNYQAPEGDSRALTKAELDSGTLKINLLDANGNQKTNTELQFDLETLRKSIRERVEYGVVNFFVKLREVFAQEEVTKNIDTIHVFLAGNSSRSPLVTQIFEQHIQETIARNNDGYNKFDIQLYPPLGTDEARKKQQDLKRPLTDTPDWSCQPTGKTGVAFGLIQCREDGEIKIIDRDKDATGHAKFRFYVGKSRKGKFVPLLSMDSATKTWVEMLNVGTRISWAIHFSDLPEAGDVKNELPITKTYSISCPIQQPQQANYQLFVRIISANEIEYALAPEIGKIDEKKAVTVNLEERND